MNAAGDCVDGYALLRGLNEHWGEFGRALVAASSLPAFRTASEEERKPIRAKSKKPRPAKRVEVEEVPVAEESPPRKVPVEELRQRIDEHNRKKEELRERMRERDCRRLEIEMARAREEADEMRRQEEERRQVREAEIRQRLVALQARREQREVEHEVSNRRSRAVLSQASTLESIAQRVAEQEQHEEERRRAVLAEIHQRSHAPITDGIDNVQKLLQQVKERARLREAQLRESQLEAPDIAPVYAGKSYEGAVLQLAKIRHSRDDEYHQRLYRQAKMLEYAKVVGQLPIRTSERKQPAAGPSHESRKLLSDEERKKLGFDYLRNAGCRKPHSGVRLEPLQQLTPRQAKRKAEYEAMCERDKKGIQYLRELRERGELVRGGQRQHSEAYNKSQMMDEIKQLRVQTNLLERRLLYGVSPDLEVTSSSEPHSAHVRFTDEPKSADSHSQSYVDVVNAKIELLKKVEDLRKRAPRDDSIW